MGGFVLRSLASAPCAGTCAFSSQTSVALAGSPLPQGVRIIPVFLTEDEVSVLRDFPVEWMTRWEIT